MPAVKLLSTPGIFLGDKRVDPPKGKTSALLYYLAYQGDRVSREDLYYLFWPDTRDQRARANLRQLVLTTKNLPFVSKLEVTPTHLNWSVDTDVQVFRDAVTKQSWQKATNLYEGALLEGLRVDGIPEFESWLELERSQLFTQYCDAVFQLCETLAAEKRYAEAAAHLERLHAVEPLDETIFRHYLNCLNLSGRPDKARRVYKHFKDTLALELGYDPEPATQKLAGRIGAEGDLAVSFEQPSPNPTLPIPATPFVGREVEMGRVIAQLSDPACRLLTLVAPGGMGKTRLALEVARRCTSTFEDGAHFIPFETVISPDLMVSAVAEALGLTFSGQQAPKDELLGYLKDKHMLLILDNLEHLLADMSLITDLLANAPNVKLLATSREYLNLQAEWLYDLGGMQVPEASSEEKRETDAVKLFVQSAKRMRAEFDLGDENLDVISRLCQQVGGMPLALELAASWLRILSPEEVLRELEQDLGILHTSAKDLPQRHLDIHAVFEASWSRLPAGAQAALQKLAVFEGGFSKEAASEVAEVGLPLLLLLVNKAFLRQDSSRRLTPHPLMWQFIRKKAFGTPLYTRAEEQHARYYATFTQQRQRFIWGTKVKQVRNEINLELPNIRRAWNFATKRTREDLLGQASLALFFLFVNGGRYDEGAAFFKKASQVLSSESLVHARVLHHYGGLLNSVGQFAEGRLNLERSLAIKRRLGVTWDTAHALLALGLNYIWSDYVTRDKQVELWRECANLFANSGDEVFQDRALSHLAEHLTEPIEREHLLRQVLPSSRVKQGNHALSTCLNNLAKHLAYTKGEFQEATDFVDEAVTIERQHGNPSTLSSRQALKGQTLFYQGRLEEAETCFIEVLGIGSKANRSPIISSLINLSHLYYYQGRADEAQSYLSEARRLIQKPDYIRSPALYFSALDYVILANDQDRDASTQLKKLFKRLSQIKNINLENAWSKVHSLNIYGRITLEQGEAATAKQHLLEALKLAQTWHFRPAVLHLLPSFAMLYLQEDRVVEARELIHFALNDTASMFQTKDAAQNVLEGLPESTTDLEPERGQGLTLELVSKNIIHDFGSNLLS